MRSKYLFLITVFHLTLTFSQNQEVWQEGNSLYNDGKFIEAILKYESILEDGVHSAELYFNLGNAHYKLNNIAPSIYYYEKALDLAPNDPEIQQNIAFARNMTIDDIDIIPEVGFSKLFKTISNFMSYDGWAYLSVIGVVVFVLLYLLYYFSYNTGKKRMAFVGSLSFLALSCVALFFAFNKYGIDATDNPAIIFAQEALVKSEPNLRSEELFRLHEGTKVQILDTVMNWKKVKLTDGKTGWIQSEELRLLSKI